MKFNKDWKTRDTLIFGSLKTGENDYVRFEGMKADTLQTLITALFADPNEKQNEAPTIKRFLAFMKKWPQVTAHGYVIGIQREDYRVSIEGIDYTGEVSKALMVDAANFGKGADDFTLGSLGFKFWWD